jgi:CheY-like chemotaxis protein
MIVMPFANAEGDASAQPGAPGAIAVGAMDEERTLLGIRQARDTVLARNRELIDKLAASEDQIAELTYERDDAIGERQEAQRQVAALAQQNGELQARIGQLDEQLAAITRERDEAREAADAHALEVAALRGQLEAGGGVAADTAPTAAEVSALQAQLAAALEEREQISAEQAEHEKALSEQLAAAQSEWQLAQQEVARMRAELAAQENNRAEEKLLLEARIAALEARTSAPAAPAPAGKKTSASSPKKGVSRLPPPPPPPTPGGSAAAQKPNPIADAQLRESVAVIRRGIESLQSQPVTPECLAEVEKTLRGLAALTGSGDLDAVHHLSSLGADVAGRLHAAPARLAATLPVLAHSTEMLGWLAMRGRAAMLDLTGALVYAVDDDVDNCECVATALEKVAVQTKYSVRPDAALEQIAANRCDLIVLDVDLPGMNGFELHKRIRALPGCATTPIIFLSGHLSTAERLAALGDEHSQFAPKPYNLGELTLRILASLVEARLG